MKWFEDIVFKTNMCTAMVTEVSDRDKSEWFADILVSKLAEINIEIITYLEKNNNWGISKIVWLYYI